MKALRQIRSQAALDREQREDKNREAEPNQDAQERRAQSPHWRRARDQGAWERSQKSAQQWGNRNT